MPTNISQEKLQSAYDKKDYIYMHKGKIYTVEELWEILNSKYDFRKYL